MVLLFNYNFLALKNEFIFMTIINNTKTYCSDFCKLMVACDLMSNSKLLGNLHVIIYDLVITANYPCKLCMNES